MLARLGVYLTWWGDLSREERDRFLHDLRDKKIDDSKAAEIKALARYWLHRDNVSWNCGSCLMDAHILLVRLKIEDMEERTTEYTLLTGTILHDPINKDFSLILMPPKLTEELALYHLAFNPRAAQYFTQLPKDVDKRIAAYLAEKSEELRAKALPSAQIAMQKYEAKTPKASAEPTPKPVRAKKASAEPAPEQVVEAEVEQTSDKQGEA